MVLCYPAQIWVVVPWFHPLKRRDRDLKVRYKNSDKWVWAGAVVAIALMLIIGLSRNAPDRPPAGQAVATPGGRVLATTAASPPTSPKPKPPPKPTLAPRWTDVAIPEALPGWQTVKSQGEPHPGVTKEEQARIRWCGKQPLADTPENRSKGQVWLTFDDAPKSAGQLETIVGVLNHYGIRGRFFALGNWADRPEAKPLLRQIEQQGHFIGNHTYSHQKLFFVNHGTQPGMWLVHEQAAGVIKDELRKGVQSSMLRFPYGAYDDRALKAASGLRGPNGERVSVCSWTVDAEDWRKDITPEKELSNIKSGMSPNAVVLMHMFGKYTGQILPELIEWLRANGYRMEPLKQP